MKFTCALCGFNTTDAKEAGEHAYSHMAGEEHKHNNTNKQLPDVPCDDRPEYVRGCPGKKNNSVLCKLCDLHELEEQLTKPTKS